MDLKMKSWVVSVFSSEWEYDQLTDQTSRVYNEATIIGTFLTRAAAGRAMVQTKQYAYEYGARRGFKDAGTTLAYYEPGEGRKCSEIEVWLESETNTDTEKKKKHLIISIKMEQMSIGSIWKYGCYEDEES